MLYSIYHIGTWWIEKKIIFLSLLKQGSRSRSWVGSKSCQTGLNRTVLIRTDPYRLNRPVLIRFRSIFMIHIPNHFLKPIYTDFWSVRYGILRIGRFGMIPKITNICMNYTRWRWIMSAGPCFPFLPYSLKKRVWHGGTLGQEYFLESLFLKI